MIDIHNHILPGVDDGAKTEEDSLKMARQAIEQGIHTIIATPHHRTTNFFNPKDTIETHVDILNELFQKHNLPLSLLAGQETRLHGDFIKDLEEGQIQTLNHTKYVFVELPHDQVPLYTDSMLYDIQMEGYKPIIVHPERNKGLREDPDRLYEFVRRGSLTQITSGSLLGDFGKEVARFTEELIRHGLTHFVASDAHNTTSRPINLAQAYDYIQEQFGAEIYYNFLENAEYMIKNENIYQSEPEVIRRRRFFGLF